MSAGGDASSSPLMVSISGVRGIAGKSLNEEVVTNFVTAFVYYQLKNQKNPLPLEETEIVLGRDSRVSGPWIEELVIKLLKSIGVKVVSCGIQPTPTIQLITLQRKNAIAGIVVTSSHNPVEWNGLKFIEEDGLFLSPDKCGDVFGLVESKQFNIDMNKEGTLTPLPSAGLIHIDECLSLPFVDVNEIGKKNLTIVLDAVNGAGGEIMPQLLERMGCNVIKLFCETTGEFGHSPEPIPENLSILCDEVKKNNASLGIAVDPDVDRCVFIDETGSPLGEEYTLALAVDFYLKYSGKRGIVCKNLSSSKAIDDAAAKYGCEVVATPVGEIHVAKKMVECNAVIGGEGNGGVMLPDIHIGRDALVAATLVLMHLARFEGTISQLKATLPQYQIVKLKAPLAGLNPDLVIQQIYDEYVGKEEYRLNMEDGLRIDGKSWWVHLRKSNTEPIIRVIGEDVDLPSATQRCSEFLSRITKMTS